MASGGSTLSLSASVTCRKCGAQAPMAAHVDFAMCPACSAVVQRPREEAERRQEQQSAAERQRWEAQIAERRAVAQQRRPRDEEEERRQRKEFEDRVVELETLQRQKEEEMRQREALAGGSVGQSRAPPPPGSGIVPTKNVATCVHENKRWDHVHCGMYGVYHIMCLDCGIEVGTETVTAFD